MTHPNDAILALTRAYHFAANRHVDQRRKGEAAEPYMNHLTEVAELVAWASAGEDPVLVIGAVLHDTVEDTSATTVELAAEFGADVAELVGEVTDDKSLPKQARKDLQIEHARLASDRAKMIKMADKISNLRSLAASPPKDWSAERKAEYVAWATRVVDGCRSANARLSQEFDRAAGAAAAQ